MSYQNSRSPSSAKMARSPRATGRIPWGKENNEFKYQKGDRVLIREPNDSHWNVGKVYPDEGGKGSTFMVRQEDENGRVCRSGRFYTPDNLRDIPFEYVTGMQTYPALSETFPHRNYERLEFVWAAVGAAKRSGTAQLFEAWVPAMYLAKSSSRHSVIVLKGEYTSDLPRMVSRVRPYED